MQNYRYLDPSDEKGFIILNNEGAILQMNVQQEKIRFKVTDRIKNYT